MNIQTGLLPICIYDIVNLAEKKDSLKGTTVYGQIVEVGIPKVYHVDIVEDKAEKQWCKVEVMGITIPKRSIQNCITQPGYDYIRNNIKQYHRIGGVVYALLDLSKEGVELGSYVEIDNATWMRPYRDKYNTYALSRWKYIAQGKFELEALVCTNLREDREAAEVFRSCIDIETKKIKALETNINKPICGVEGNLPPRLSPRGNIVDKEYQQVQIDLSSLSNSGSRLDGSTAIYTKSEEDFGVGDTNSESWRVPERAFYKVENVVQDREDFKYLDTKRIEDLLKEALELKKAHYVKIKEKAKELYKDIAFTDEYYAKIAQIIKDYWNSKPSVPELVGKAGGVLKGKEIFINAVKEAIPCTAKRGRIENWVSMYNENLADFLVNTYRYASSGREAEVTEKIIYENRYLVYLAMLKEVLKIRVDLVKVYNSLTDKELLQYILIKNPYVLAYIRSQTTLRDMDRLAMITDDFGSDGQLYVRGIAALVGCMRGTLASDARTEGTIIYKMAQVEGRLQIATEFRLTESEYNLLEANGLPFTVSNLINLMYYVKPNIDLEEVKKRVYTEKGKWALTKDRREAVRKIGERVDKARVLQAYTGTGMGVNIDNRYLVDTKLLEDSVLIYKKLEAIQCQAATEPLDDATINRYRISFERSKRAELGKSDFHLEGKQCEALKLLHNGVIAVTGLAGSGKTTVAEALVYLLKNAYGIEDEEILFVAPTGKAANRLKETVKKPTSTIHRAFKIGVASEDVDEMTYEVSGALEVEPRVLIIDENSMVGTELMAAVLKCIPETTKIIFLGDIEQLPSINVGKPFSDMLNFIPTVALDVVKRAAEASQITKNARQLIKEPNKELEKGADFKIIPSAVEDIVPKMKELCKYYKDGTGVVTAGIEALKGKGLADLQIITPFRQGKNAVGTEKLNNELHDIFNSYVPNTYKVVVGDASLPNMKWLEYRIGDRVIHTKNAAQRPRFKVDNNLNVELLAETGVMNGDVGYVRYIVESTELQYDKEIMEDNLMQEDNIYYIFVEYKGINKESYYIAYGVTSIVTQGKVIRVGVTALEELDLAFALTVHKMQGSQANNVIVVWPKSKAPMLNRNMLYTAITRAKEGVTIIGDVEGVDNSIKRAAGVQAMSKRLSLVDILESR